MLKAWLLTAAGFMAFLGASTTANHETDKKDLNGTHASPTVQINISCVAAAVAAREQALDAAMTTETASINAAYSDRAAALASAYAQSDLSAIRKAVKTSWQKFSAALRLAHRSWKSSQQSAWSQFKMALKACGPAAASAADSGNANIDAAAGGSD